MSIALSGSIPATQSPASVSVTGSRPLLHSTRTRREKFLESILSFLCVAAIIIAIFPLVSLLYYLVSNGWMRLDLALFSQLPPAPGQAGGGIANAILGTCMVVGIAAGIAVPVGILVAVYISEFKRHATIATVVLFATNALSGVPAIISGVFVYGILVESHILGYSAMAGGVALSILMLPTIIRSTYEALLLVPQELRWAAFGVGCSPFQTALGVVVPSALTGIFSGILLAVARAAGETAPLIFTALYSPFWPRGVMEPIASLSVLIFNFATAPFQPLQQLAWAASLVLVMLVLSARILVRCFLWRR